MKEIKEIIWKDSPNTCAQEAVKHLSSKEIPRLFEKSEFEDLKKEARMEVSEILQKELSNIAIIATGHQPDFQHPGILFKDLMACRISHLANGIAIHLTVDTDTFEISYHYPVTTEQKTARVKDFILQKETTYLDGDLNKEEREELILILKDQLRQTECFVSEKNLSFSRKNIAKLIELLSAGVKIQNVNEMIRQEFLRENSIKLNELKVSALSSTNSFRKFVKKIENNYNEFHRSHNKSLNAYRTEHKIKNHAQPLPDLEEGEMPFWKTDRTGKRLPLKVGESDSNIIYPRALTLTMFVRLFLCDFFIHGTGGARYEDVSERVLKDFFGEGAAPFRTASATMHLGPTLCFEIKDISEEEIRLGLRSYEHSPDKLLDKNHPLVLEKMKVLKEFENPEIDRSKVHSEVLKLNEKIRELLGNKKEELEIMKRDFPTIDATNKVFKARNYPFYYYDIIQLLEEVKSIT